MSSATPIFDAAMSAFQQQQLEPQKGSPDPSKLFIHPAMAAAPKQDVYGRVIGTVDSLSITLDESHQMALIPQALRDIAANLATQDNRATSSPIFLVQKKVRQTGMDLNYCDNYVWIDMAGDCGEVTDPEEIAHLEELDEKYPLTEEESQFFSGYVKTGYLDRWETVQPFFTEAAAQRFINSNKHRHEEGLRIYVDSAYRNPEWQTVRNFLLSLNPPKASSAPVASTSSTPSTPTT